MTSDKATDTWVTAPKHVPSGSREACLVHIYPTGADIGRRYPLGADSILLGRGEDADIRVPDNSVSRRHAKIEPTTDGYYVLDLGSTNGTFVGDKSAAGPELLRDGDYVRVGNCIYKFLTGGNIESDYHEEIYRLTIVDGLTNIHNQRYMLDFLERELARSVRHDRPLALLMFDIDKFKSINDRFGHLCGDFVLRELSRRIRDQVRREDLFARYGGEEFGMVLVETSLPQAMEVAERVRSTVDASPFKFETQAVKLTVSVGVAGTTGNEAGLSSAELIRRADDRLYAAKNGGRNRVEC
jgi:two-component system, cell cycle response regulator